MKETKATVERRLEIIKLRFNCHLAIDYMSGRPRIGRGDLVRPDEISRYLSPRGTKTEIALWLDGFIEALELKEMIGEECRRADELLAGVKALRGKFIDADDLTSQELDVLITKYEKKQ